MDQRPYRQNTLISGDHGPRMSTAAPAFPRYNRLDPSNPGIMVQFYRADASDHPGDIHQLTRLKKQPSYQQVTIDEACKLVREPLIVGSPHIQCHLFRLPIEVRFKIYEILFAVDNKAVEVGRLRHVGAANLAILRTCHVIYHEASIAFYHSLSYRKLFLRSYGSVSAYILQRQPMPLPCCRDKVDKWLKYPCPNDQLNWRRPYRSVTMLIGATDFNIASRRRWEFLEFITTLRMTESLRVYSLTIVVTENWRSRGFSERSLINALFSGAIEFLGTLRLQGFTKEERDRLCQLIPAKRTPPLRILRDRKKIRGPGFSIWVCESPAFISLLLVILVIIVPLVFSV